MFNKPTSGDHLEADLATFTMTLVNKTLFGVPDQDTFYDQSDYMEELGIEGAEAKRRRSEAGALALRMAGFTVG